MWFHEIIIEYSAKSDKHPQWINMIIYDDLKFLQMDNKYLHVSR